MIKEVISSKDLQTAINGLSQVINNYCKHEGGGIVFICIMKGGFMFFSDLIKKIKYPIEVDFVKCSSYDGFDQKSIFLAKIYTLPRQNHFLKI